jgi:ribonuclease III
MNINDTGTNTMNKPEQDKDQHQKSFAHLLDLPKIQTQIEYTFNDERLLLQALVHRSYINDRDHDEQISEHNERLEFLGDAVLELIVTDYLFEKSGQNEGVMTTLRSSLVNYRLLGQIGNELGLDTQILLSKGEREELGKARITIVADAMEALIGAIYKDGGFEPTVKFIHQFILRFLPDILENGSIKDEKTQIQEFCQKHTKITPHYRIIGTEGKDHEKVFTVGIWIGAEKISEGAGRSKQDAETEAAKAGLEILKLRYSQG